MAYKSFVIALGSMLIASAPAAAGTNAKAERAKASDPTGATKEANEKKFCVQETNTGSHLSSKKDCRTRAEWAQEGVDIDEFVKTK